MRKSIEFLGIFICLATGCHQSRTMKTEKYSGDQQFQKLSEEFLTGYFNWRPQLAVALGIHDYDGMVTDFSKASIRDENERLRKYDRLFADFDSVSLQPALYYDLRILQAGIRNELFTFEDMGSYTKNPMLYAGAPDVSIYIKRDFAPLEDRLKSIISIERKAPDIFQRARTNLEDSLARPYVETAVEIARGAADFLQHDLVKALGGIKNDSLMKAFMNSNHTAAEELNSFANYLEKEKLPKAHDHFALGKEKYTRMLSNEYIDLSPEKVLAIGMSELNRQQEIFDSAARVIDPHKKPVDVYQEIKKEHPTAQSLIPDARRDLEMIRQFIVDKHIVDIPSSVRVTVQETPPYARSTSTASMDTPGPFEKKATAAYYYITPVDPSWSPRQKEDWLSMFDYYTTDNVSVHEAYPGHYIQFLHLNASPATRIEKVFGSYAFIEGWAHYCEEMMVNEGFGNPGDPVKAAKYRLAQTGDALLRICRLCVSIRMHCEGMTVDEATRFFMKNWHQGEKPSQQEAIRGTFDPGYLYYSLGKLEIMKLRSDYRKQEGDNFSLSAFHNRMLDHGMPPIRLLREVLLKDKNQWNEIL